jgi:hypothetical protein
MAAALAASEGWPPAACGQGAGRKRLLDFLSSALLACQTCLQGCLVDMTLEKINEVLRYLLS